MTTLSPRLSTEGVDLGFEVYKDSGKAVSADLIAPYVSYASSGGAQNSAFIVDLSKWVLKKAEELGFPEQKSQVAQVKFDRSVAEYLGHIEELRTGEFIRDDTWAYLSCCLLPDVVNWRFPGFNRDRYAGGDRNCFQRLFRRAVTLDLGDESEDRWGLLRTLTEDAFVAIFERGMIAARPNLVRAIAQCWVSHSKLIGRGRMERVMRSAIKLIRFRNVPYDMEWMDEATLHSLVNECFQKAAEIELVED